jgi:YD repeat-containing protein
LTNDTYQGGQGGGGTRAYDAENRVTSAQINSSQSASYTYDADGRRVKRNTGAEEVWQVYGLWGGGAGRPCRPGGQPGAG